MKLYFCRDFFKLWRINTQTTNIQHQMDTKSLIPIKLIFLQAKIHKDYAIFRICRRSSTLHSTETFMVQRSVNLNVFVCHIRHISISVQLHWFLGKHFPHSLLFFIAAELHHHMITRSAVCGLLPSTTLVGI